MATVLIIEDDPRLDMTYDILFERAGHKVLRARDGREGLEIAESENPDVILLDILMPIKNGVQFLQEFDVKNRHPDTKVIVFSNMESSDLVKQAMELGAYRYEVKSRFSPKEVGALVDEALADRPKAEL